MRKRSAMTIAGALVAALLAGSVAFSLGSLGPGTAAARDARTAPRVRTIERTVTVHKKRPSSAGTITYAVAAPTSEGSESEGDDDGFEHEGDEDSSGSHEDDGSEGFEDD
jgi:hypothetical protein